MATNSYQVERPNRQENAAVFPRVVQQCLHVKQQIIGELIAGRLQLLEAATRFRAAHSVSTASLASATGMPVAVADSENICRTMIGWVFLSLSNRPEEAERVSNRLECELQRHLDRCGPVNLLPDR